MDKMGGKWKIFIESWEYNISIVWVIYIFRYNLYRYIFYNKEISWNFVWKLMSIVFIVVILFLF